MPNTYSQLYIQIVFAVKGRRNFILENYREELQKYITGILQANKQKMFAIYCMPDHTHLLVSIKPDIAISSLVRDVKANSSLWLKKRFTSFDDFAWQEGFGAFSYAKSQVQHVVEYILNQQAHHKRKTFREEYLDFLKKFEVEYEEKYLFEFYG